jgi:SAM-dependent methyltransferase
MTMMSIDWHDRYLQQARWTQDMRAYLYAQTGLDGASRILDLGCGTGALFGEILARSEASLYGLDRCWAHLKLIPPKTGLYLTQGDAHQTPYTDNYFDITLCHFTLLWVANPAQVVCEMARITRPGGAVLALAEPDYGGRIDYPIKLAQMGKWQIESLRSQGADPLMGRKLATIFNSAGFDSVETGVLGGQWSGQADLESWQAEWEIFEHDIKLLSEPDKIAERLRIKELDKTAWETGQRVLFVPTLYAMGKVAQYKYIT